MKVSSVKRKITLSVRQVPEMKNRPHGKMNPLTEDEKKYIIDNHKRQTITQMKQHLRRAPGTIAYFLATQKLEPFRTGFRKPSKDRVVLEGCFDPHDKKMFI